MNHPLPEQRLAGKGKQAVGVSHKRRAIDTLGGREGLAEALADDEGRGEWLDGIGSKLYEKISMCSEEKQRRRDVTDTMQVQLDNPRSTESGRARPQIYRGAAVDYVRWRSSWQERGRDSEESEEVQLNQLNKTIPEKNQQPDGPSRYKDNKGLLERI
jgi:hypothetical protein